MHKKSLKEASNLEKLSKKSFKSQDDAVKGRPCKETKPDYLEYYVTGDCCSVAEQTRREAEASLGCFVLATNDLDCNLLNAAEFLKTYKSQQQVERGFRFLKSPDFLVSSLYLEKPERIEALLMVMTLCLMIYAAIQHRIRHELKRQNRTFPDQKKRPYQNPTGRWVFYCFEGIHVLTVNGSEKCVVGINDEQSTIIAILGQTYQSIYS